jgi:hypothetical protein
LLPLVKIGVSASTPTTTASNASIRRVRANPMIVQAIGGDDAINRGAHFNHGKIDAIGYGKESGEQLTSEEINTFLKANNGDQPIKKQRPNAWVGNNVIAEYHKEGAAWRLAIMAHAQDQRKPRKIN